MITIVENEITVSEYLDMRARVNWRKLSEKQAEQAIQNSLYFVKAIDENEQIVGIGRIVGDGAVICYIQDLIVDPRFQKQKIGSLIISKLIAFVESIHEEETPMMLCLMCAKGREAFYEKHGFMARPNDNLGPGMIRFL
ncbi:MAG: GNAT family N-acetyltransferase [Lachnospiraceae bacterium]|nr:GNAT family N-acetyltransferase [Lachnospiraceae bacterium]